MPEGVSALDHGGAGTPRFVLHLDLPPLRTLSGALDVLLQTKAPTEAVAIPAAASQEAKALFAPASRQEPLPPPQTPGILRSCFSDTSKVEGVGGRPLYAVLCRWSSQAVGRRFVQRASGVGPHSLVPGAAATNTAGSVEAPIRHRRLRRRGGDTHLRCSDPTFPPYDPKGAFSENGL
ncbi:hypothetical protein cyc_08844 [Cyclospora cayetanensis]|uniref:Uncharacterized protein n=1 Tax=Cyclospora cayetanensis TaxID=88456 RepID=A0A1D3D244_9EIME|nr:hypothetical protein cyc_08844 [Cyclospora cayetanensis]